MIDKLISFSIQNKLVIAVLVLGVVAWGLYSFKQIPIDAVPDITTNQVQVITQAPTLAAQEVEQFITFPVEIALANLPDVVEIRSISRFAISVVTVVFEEDVDIYRARQLISEQLKIAESEIPDGFGSPELGPITTGLGEVYQYILRAAEGYEDVYSDMDLRTINDWIVKRQLAGTPGIIEMSGWGGHLKQYEVAVNPEKLKSMNISVAEVFEALQNNNENTGGSYIEQRYNTYFIRGEGLVKSLDDIENIVVKTMNGIPLLIRDIATVGYGSSPRYGAITWNGKGEVVGGQALMLKGENSFEVVNAVKERIEQVKMSLPEGVVLEPYIDRSELIGRAVNTVTENLVLGGLIVIFILILLLGNVRGGLIVASTIPLSMLVALGLMNLFGVSANLMSLGALDFGIIVDGAVIIVESVVYYLSTHYVKGQTLAAAERDQVSQKSSSKMMRSAFFGQLIILIVFIPILTLSGIEGKMFRPMAQTVSFAMIGAIILSLTYVPMMSAWFLRIKSTESKSYADRIVAWLTSKFDSVIRIALQLKSATIGIAGLLLVISLFLYTRLGGEFIPTLEEGDFALHQILPPGSSLAQSVEVSEKIQNTLLSEFPEVETVVSKIGTAEVPTDPMPIEVGDIMVRMKPKKEWTSAKNREEMFERMEEALSKIPGVQYEFTQPIQMRFNELIAGVREDIAIKIYGENPDILFQKGKEAEQLIKGINGIGDLRLEQTQGLPQMMVSYQRNKVAQYGLNIKDINQTLRIAFAGEKAGVVFEGEKRFDLVVRLDESHRQNIDDIRKLFISLPNGNQIPLKEVANIEFVDGPMQISREDAKRRITVGVNARGRDIESLVEEISDKLNTDLDLPPGYFLEYGGTFENLKEAKQRLSVAVPIALALIFVLVFFALKSLKQTFMIFMSIPLAAIGGVLLLWIRDMPFSISAGIGFIVLSGVAVLNGLVLISSLNDLRAEGTTSITEIVIKGTKRRIRPILLTASTDILGFLPMALSASAGAEVQRPLATVVIGGLITATLLTLIVLPVLYSLFENVSFKLSSKKTATTVLLVMIGFGFTASNAEAQSNDPLTLESAINIAKANHPMIKGAKLGVEQQKVLKKSAIGFDKTYVNYSSGQLNSSEIDYQWQINQKFKFPTTYISQSKLQKQKFILSERELAISELELERNIRTSWWQLAYVQEKNELIRDLANTFKRFADAAAKRYKAGEINFLEKVNAESNYQKMMLKQSAADTDILIYEQELLRWMGIDSIIDLPAISLDRVELNDLENTSSVSNAMISYYKQNVAVSNQELRLKKSAYLPDLSVGYFDQQVEGISGLNGFQVGIGIPLFFWTQQGKVQAAKLNSQKAEMEYKNQILAVSTQLNTNQLEITKYKTIVDWYEEVGLANASEMLRFANKAYQSGALGYLEYLNSLSQALDLRTEYLDALNQYNQSVTEYQFLSGRFQ